MPKNDKGQFINVEHSPVGTCSICGGEVLANIVSGGVADHSPDWSTAKCQECGAVATKNRNRNVVAMAKR